MSASVILLQGHEFLVDEQLRAIRGTTDADPLSEVVLDASAPAAEMIAALETPSLLGGTRLVVIEGVESLRKDQVQALESYARSPSPHAQLVLVAGGRTPLAGVVRDVGEVVALEAPRGRRLVAWIRRRAQGRSLRLDDRASWALIDSVGSELRDLEMALDQLRTALGTESHVGASEVRRVFPRRADERIYAFTDAVGDRRLSTAMEALRRLFEQGDEPLVLFGALVSQVRRMLIARGIAEGGPRAVRDLLGLPEWRAEHLLRQARSYREEELIAALAALAAADVDMKSGDLPPEVALERTVIAIVEPRSRSLGPAEIE
jgi:DNA polymerase-3 subunit delta